MNEQIKSVYAYATLTSGVALVLSILPMPESWTPWHISWAQLVVIYWCIALPHYFGIKYAWLIGLLMDLLHHDILGQNALLFVLLAYTAITLRQFVLYLPVWRQSLLVGIMLLVPTSLSVWLDTLIYGGAVSWQPWGTVLSSVCLWPWVFAVLRSLRQKARLPRQ